MGRRRRVLLWPLLLLALALLGWAGVLAARRPVRLQTLPEAGPVASVVVRADVEVVPDRAAVGVERALVFPRVLLVTPGEVVRLRAEGYDAQGRPVGDVRVRWEVVKPGAGTIGQDGVYRAPLQEGEFPDAIRAVVQDPATGTRAEATASVVVRAPAVEPGRPERLRVYPDPVRAAPGEAVPLYAVPLDAEGRPLASGPVTWRVLDPRAGTVTPQGVFTAGSRPGRYPGALEAALPSGGPVARVDVVVEEPPAEPEEARAYVVPDPIALRPGQEVQLVAGAASADGTPLPIRGVEWVLRTPEAGVLTPSGRFRASSRVGDYPDAVEAQVQLPDRVLIARAGVRILPERPVPAEETSLPERVVVEPRLLILPPGATRRLVAVALDGAGRPLRGVDLRWEVVDPRAGQVGPDGLFRAGDRPGRYVDAVRVVAQWNGRSAEATVTVVVTGRLARAEIRPRQARVAPGQAVRFRVVAYDENGTPLPDVEVEWGVADPRAGTIDAAGRFVAGDAPGFYPGAVTARVVQRAP